MSRNIIVQRDCMIVTTLDLCTSLMAGTTIFGILGNLAHETDSEDISTVVRAGTGLAFVSYPEALAKFTVVPQLFAVLFFLMLFVLGIGTTVAFCNVIISIVNDQFPKLRQWKIAAGLSILGFGFGIVYCTPVSVARKIQKIYPCALLILSICYFVDRVANTC